MASSLVLQHVACEGPARIAHALAERGVARQVVRIDLGEAVPPTLDGHDALVVMGGPMGVYEADRFPHLRDELRLIERAIAAGKPVLGICLGSQLIAAALGARVAPGPSKEIGWYEVTLSAAATGDRLLGRAPHGFVALHWHGDQFELPAGAVPLASSAVTPHQAFRHGETTWGILFHLEVDLAQVEAMTRAFPDELAAAGMAPQSLLREAPDHLRRLTPIGDSALGPFADLVAGRAAG